MIRVGIVDCDTSHVVQFPMRLNHIEIDEEQWVDGAQVVCAYRGTSKVTPDETMDNYVGKLKEFGVEMVDSLEDMLGKVDAVCVESQEGSVHFDRAKPFIEAGLPVYIDKPFASSAADAKRIGALAAEHNVPLFSTSSLRYGLEVVDLVENEEMYGKVIGASAWSPASLHDRNPGLYHYGIHGVETLYALMGSGCVEVSCTFEEGTEVTVGRWADGRIGEMRGTRAGAHSYGFTAWCEKEVVTTSINAGYVYRELLKRMVAMFETRQAPLDINVTIELVAFIEAAMHSAQQGGATVKLAV